MLEHEFVSRSIMNVLDNENHYDYILFLNEDLYDQMIQYMSNKLKDDPDSLKAFLQVMKKDKKTIDRLAKQEDVSLRDYNLFMEDLRAFRRKYILKK